MAIRPAPTRKRGPGSGVAASDPVLPTAPRMLPPTVLMTGVLPPPSSSGIVAVCSEKRLPACVTPGASVVDGPEGEPDAPPDPERGRCVLAACGAAARAVEVACAGARRERLIKRHSPPSVAERFGVEAARAPEYRPPAPKPAPLLTPPDDAAQDGRSAVTELGSTAASGPAAVVEPAGVVALRDANEGDADGSSAAVRSFGACASGVHKQASPVVGRFSLAAAPAAPSAVTTPPTTAHRATAILSITTKLHRLETECHSPFEVSCDKQRRCQGTACEIRREIASRGDEPPSRGRSVALCGKRLPFIQKLKKKSRSMPARSTRRNGEWEVTLCASENVARSRRIFDR